MKSALMLLALLFAGCVQQGFAYEGISVSRVGDSFLVSRGGVNIYFEPSGIPAGPAVADYVFFSYDDCDKESMIRISNENTTVIGPLKCVEGIQGHTYSMGQTDSLSFRDGTVRISSVPIEKGTGDKGNGYYVSVGGKSVYFIPASDSVPLVKQRIDVAFLPDAGPAALLKPKVVVPTMGNSDVFSKALDGSGIQVKAI
ncbi:MAG: hypothetical protein HY365_00155 [Candidatus Aenigmarchaeota archaeon]|nr:hypothetical protein [Candidatus Aenigmarchaeota archaeon]